jgi:hypothetical protein
MLLILFFDVPKIASDDTTVSPAFVSQPRVIEIAHSPQVVARAYFAQCRSA